MQRLIIEVQNRDEFLRQAKEPGSGANGIGNKNDSQYGKLTRPNLSLA